MAKKNRDLFEVLGSKRALGAPGTSSAETDGRRGAKPSASGKNAEQRASGAHGAGNLLGRMQAFFVPPSSAAGAGSPDAMPPKSQQSRPRRARPATAADRHTLPATASRSGVVIAGIAFACLALGFVIGRVSDGQAAPNQELNVRNPNNAAGTNAAEDSFGVRPAALGDPATAPLSDQELTERLSTHGYVLLTFDAPQSAGGDRDAFERAKPFAQWLRDRGFSKVRLRTITTGTLRAWAVVLFVDDPADTSIRERLLALDPPEHVERFRRFLGKQLQPILIN